MDGVMSARANICHKEFFMIVVIKLFFTLWLSSRFYSYTGQFNIAQQIKHHFTELM